MIRSKSTELLLVAGKRKKELERSGEITGFLRRRRWHDYSYRHEKPAWEKCL